MKEVFFMSNYEKEEREGQGQGYNYPLGMSYNAQEALEKGASKPWDYWSGKEIVKVLEEREVDPRIISFVKGWATDLLRELFLDNYGEWHHMRSHGRNYMKTDFYEVKAVTSEEIDSFLRELSEAREKYLEELHRKAEINKKYKARQKEKIQLGILKFQNHLNRYKTEEVEDIAVLQNGWYFLKKKAKRPIKKAQYGKDIISFHPLETLSEDFDVKAWQEDTGPSL